MPRRIPHSVPTVQYFAFGSNMDVSRMQQRDIPFRRRRWGILHGYTLTFDKQAAGAAGEGYATIDRDPDESVEGVLYETTWAGIRILDGYEGVPNHYWRLPRWIVQADGSRVRAVVYIANPQMVVDGLRPAQRYLDHLLVGRDLLSPEYVALLETVEVATPVRRTGRRFSESDRALWQWLQEQHERYRQEDLF
jgi:hypothetical protein